MSPWGRMAARVLALGLAVTALGRPGLGAPAGAFAAVAPAAADPDGDALAERVERLHAEGRWQRALEAARELCRHREERLGPGDPRTGSAHSDLGGLLELHGDSLGAERELRGAVAVLERCTACSVELGIALDQLASVRAARGDFVDEARLLERATALLESAGSAAELTLAAVLRHDARRQARRAGWPEAEQLLRRAMTIHQKRGAELELAKDLVELGTMLRRQGRVSDALDAFEQARDIEQRLLGPTHPELGRLHRAIGEHFQRSNLPDQASREYARAEQIMVAALGPEHPWLADLYGQWGLLAASRSDIETAVRVRKKASAIEERVLARHFVGGSELDRLLFAKTLRRSLDVSMALQLALGDRSKEIIQLGLEAVLRTKGRVLDAAAGEIAQLRSSLAPDDRELLDRLAALRSELGTRALAGPGSEAPAHYAAELERLEREGMELERAVSGRSARFRASTEPVTLEAVRQQLPEDAALVEYVRYQPLSLVAHSTAAERIGEARYFAYVVRRTGGPYFLQLSLDAPTLDRLTLELRARLEKPDDPRGLELASRLWPVVVGRLGPVLDGVRHLVLVPDGALSLLPFAALIDLEGRPLAARYALSTLTSGRDLLRLAHRTRPRGRAVVLASPDYGAVAGGEEGQLGFVPLPGTVQEALAIAELMPGASVWRDGDASEQALLGLAGPRILHVATHGFFLGEVGARGTDGPGAAPARARGPRAIDPTAARFAGPLARSGLALAGANLGGARSDGHDGVLTALELAGLDFRGTELVVLSACDTAVGAVETGEGVLGLRRALVLAGAESSVMSLWKVDDDATRELMVSFYGKLLRDGLGRAEALRRAQLEIAEQPRWRHPAYWASFVLSGSFAPLGAADAAGVDAGELDADPSAPPPVHPASAGGCGCRVASYASGARGPATRLVWLALGVAVALARRRRESASRIGASNRRCEPGPSPAPWLRCRA